MGVFACGSVSCRWFPFSLFLSADTRQIHLSLMHKLDVSAEATMDLDAIMNYATFCRIWLADFPDVKISSDNRLGKCNDCLDIHEHLDAERDPQIRATWKAKQRDNGKFVKGKRLVYDTWRRACRDESHILFVNVDGMDQVRCARVLSVTLP